MIIVNVISSHFFHCQLGALFNFLIIAFIAVKFGELIKGQTSIIVSVVFIIELINCLLSIWAVKNVDVLEFSF